MSRQLRSKIVIQDPMIGSWFLDEGVIDRIRLHPSQFTPGRESFDFRARFNVRNRGAASGSIDKPSLVIKIGDLRDIVVPPQTKWLEEKRLPNNYDRDHMSFSEQITHDDGATIFLEGGASENVELEYELTKWDSSLITALCDPKTKLSYSLIYEDNDGHRFEVPVSLVGALDSVERE